MSPTSRLLITCALMLMDDLRGRLVNRVQFTTDNHKAYLQAVEETFGADMDYSMPICVYECHPPQQSTDRAEIGSPNHDSRHLILDQKTP
jgi:hypothetical protein